MTPDDPRHGTFNGYANLKCRCVECRAANTVYIQRYRLTNGPRAIYSVKASGRAERRAAKWVRENHPDVWRSLLDDAWIELTGEKAHPPGPVPRGR